MPGCALPAAVRPPMRTWLWCCKEKDSVDAIPSLRESLPARQLQQTAIAPAEAAAHLSEDLGELKTIFVAHLLEKAQRTVLFSGLDALQALVSSMPEFAQPHVNPGAPHSQGVFN